MHGILLHMVLLLLSGHIGRQKGVVLHALSLLFSSFHVIFLANIKHGIAAFISKELKGGITSISESCITDVPNLRHEHRWGVGILAFFVLLVLLDGLLRTRFRFFLCPSTLVDFLLLSCFFSEVLEIEEIGLFSSQISWDFYFLISQVQSRICYVVQR